MLRFIRALGALVLLLGVAACSKFQTYDGPEVTRIVVFKEARVMHLLHHDEVLRSYEVFLGFAPDGHKSVEGDGRTPEGLYTIDRRNPRSDFHLSLGISYPNEEDVERARRLGRDPGGDIFIHGQKSWFQRNEADWTAGCISVSNAEMEEIYAMVRNDTEIAIFP